jgi:uncharacterized protein (DUF885 family)
MNAGVRRFADAYWDDVLALKPLLATQVGDERFDDRLPDLTDSGRADAAALHQQALATLRRIDHGSLNREDRATLHMVRELARVELDSLEYRFDLLEVLSHMWGPGTLLATLGSIQRTDTAERLEKYIVRLRRFPGYVDAAVTLIGEATAARRFPPRVVIDRTVAQVERLLAADTETNPALNVVHEEQARRRVIGALDDVVLPSLRRYLAAARAAREQATEALGLVALDGGDEMYAAKVLAWNSVMLDPHELHAYGEAELARLDEERAAIGSRLGYATADEALSDAIERGDITLESREQMLALARAQVERSWETCHQYFGRLPKENCDVRPVDASREQDVLDHYVPPTADGSRPGVYYVNTIPGRPLHRLASTTYHEANPGHHLQIALELEAEDRTKIRRFGNELVASAFVEGWGLYSERLADEIGLFENDYERLGMLELQALRAMRLVVDTGIHAFGWSRERAREEMGRTGMAADEIDIEIDRYAALPAQALTYKVGQRAIEQLRERAGERDGDLFSLKSFHDRLMALGSLPLDALEAEMERND